jgi:hypothetical protein
MKFQYQSEVDSVNAALDYQKKYEQKRVDLQRERERYAKLNEKYVLAVAELKQEQLRNAQLQMRNQQLERMLVPKQEPVSESDLHGSSQLAGSTIPHAHDHEDYDDKPISQVDLHGGPHSGSSKDMVAAAPAAPLITDHEPISNVNIASRGRLVDSQSSVILLPRTQVIQPIPWRESSSSISIARLNGAQVNGTFLLFWYWRTIINITNRIAFQCRDRSIS